MYSTLILALTAINLQPYFILNHNKIYRTCGHGLYDSHLSIKLQLMYGYPF